MRFCGHCARVWREANEFCPADGAPLVRITRQSDPLAGHELDGRYRLLSLIGEGGMGFVYRAEQIGLRRHVAVKMLYAERLRDESIALRFRREARVLAKLDHPGCVRVLDVGDAEGKTPYIVMELVEGEPLDFVLARKGRLGPRSALRIGAQLADAIAAAHADGIVHRDLKPANVQLEGDLEQPTARILDFGLARLLEGPEGEEGSDAKLTREGVVFGTPEYMSPEQAMGAAVDGRTDLYSLGLVLYEMLTGAPPFRAPQPAAVLAMHLHSTPAPVQIPEIPPALEAKVASLVARLLAKRPDDRPPTVQAVARELRELEPQIVEPSSVVPLVKRPSWGPLAAPQAAPDGGGGPKAVAGERPARFSDRPWMGLSASPQGDRILEDAIAGAKRRRYAQLAVGGIALLAIATMVTTVIVRLRANDDALAQAPAPADPLTAPPPVTTPAIRLVKVDRPEIAVPGGDRQRAYEEARRGLERRLAGRGLRPRDLRGVQRAWTLWSEQESRARGGLFDDAIERIELLSEILASTPTRQILDTRLAAVSSAVERRGSDVERAAFRALRATSSNAASSPDSTRRFLLRLEELERGTREAQR
ncbi:MAG: protein kinase [Deltaproteobacteria bacterium]|nr:protein kinase [Deltaproteobacteria bacterium]